MGEIVINGKLRGILGIGDSIFVLKEKGGTEPDYDEKVGMCLAWDE